MTDAAGDSLRRWAVALAAVAVVAFALQGILTALDTWPESRVPFGDEPRYWSDAGTIAAGGDWRPEPVWPVLYPALLGLIVRLGGGPASVVALQSVLLFGAALLWGDLTRRLTGSRLAGALSGSLLLVDPQVGAFAHYLWPEIVHLFLVVAALWCLFKAPERIGALLAAGFLFGLALLTKKLLWPLLPILVLPAILEAKPFAARLRRTAVILAGTLAVLIPPAVYFGPYAISPVSSAVFNLWVGLNDRGRSSFAEHIVAGEFVTYEGSAADAAERDRIALEKVERRLAGANPFTLLREQASRQYFRLFDKDSFLTDQLPGGIIHSGGQGYRRAPASVAGLLRGWSYALYGLVLLAAVAGVLVLPPRGRYWLWALVAYLAANLVIFLFLHVKSRYRIQFLPVLYLYAGAAVAWLIDRAGPRKLDATQWRPEIGWRPAVIASAAAAMLSVWFWGLRGRKAERRGRRIDEALTRRRIRGARRRRCAGCRRSRPG